MSVKELSTIFGNSRLLIVPKIHSAILGMWNIKSGDVFQKIYNLYFFLTCACFLAFLVTEICQGIILLRQENWEEFASNFTVLLFHIIACGQLRLYRSKVMQKLIDNIDEREKCIEQDNDSNVKKIYERYTKIAQISSIFFVILGYITLTMFYHYPHFPIVRDQPINGSTEETYLPFSSWFPFDEYDHYNWAYIIQVSVGFIGTAYGISSNVLFICLFISCTANIKIIQYYFTNINKYSKAISFEEKISIKEAEVIFAKICILMHQEVIGSVNDLDELLRSFMLFNFLQSSFKLSLLLLQILNQTSFNLVFSATIFLYVIYSLAELYCFYWNANEIIVESSDGIELAICNGEWNEYSEEVKKLLLVSLMRTTHPCKIGVGPFYEMNLQAAIMIMRACYYYVCLLHQFDE